MFMKAMCDTGRMLRTVEAVNAFVCGNSGQGRRWEEGGLLAHAFQ